MQNVNVAEAKARFSELLAKVECGGEIVITRRGHAVARLTAVKRPKKPLDLSALDSLRARQPLSKVSSLRLIREMRDEKY
jgi:prevent-host-death family protein